MAKLVFVCLAALLVCALASHSGNPSDYTSGHVGARHGENSQYDGRAGHGGNAGQRKHGDSGHVFGEHGRSDHQGHDNNEHY